MIEIRQFGSKAARPQVNEDNRMSGRAAPFNIQTVIGRKEPGNGFRESINPKAFNKSIQDGDIVLLDNHDAHRPLARQSAGTFEPHAGSQGLDWRAVSANTTYARDVLENIRAQNYGGCSFSFEVVKDRWTIGADGMDERELIEVNCREVSIVTFPAYTEGTSVAARSLELGFESRSAYWAGVMEPHITEEMRASGSPKPYGDVEYGDPKNGKYPIDAEHVVAAWSYINQAKNAAKYPLNGVTLASVKARIKAAMLKHGHKVSDDANEAAPQDVRFEYEGVSLVVPVGAFDDAQWAEAQEAFRWFKQDLDYRMKGEPDESTRNLSKEETALLEKRGDEMRRAIAASRRTSFGK